MLKAVFLNCALAIVFCGFSQAGTYLTLTSAAIVGSGGPSIAYISSFGTVNALAVNGATVAGETAAAQSNGALYYIPITANISVQAGNNSGYLTAYVSTNFAHPAALVMYGCPSTAGCGGAAGYSALSTNSAAPTTLVASPGVASGTNVSIGVALWVPDNDGASAFAGTDTALATITFNVMQIHNGNGAVSTAETDTLSFTLPNVTVQTAVQLDLATSAGGLTVTPAADYSMNFGNVNGLGIGPASAGLTIVAAAGGYIYSTPYLIQPAFTDIGSTTASVNVYVSTDFAHPLVLQLDDASASAGPYNGISKAMGAQTSISNAYTDRSSNTRYLGLFVSNLNGGSAFTGADSATLTYTLTVP